MIRRLGFRVAERISRACSTLLPYRCYAFLQPWVARPAVQLHRRLSLTPPASAMAVIPPVNEMMASWAVR